MIAPVLYQQLENNLAACLRTHQPKNVVLALSGGLDSMVLLHLLSQLQPYAAWQLLAVHVHHGLQADADQWLTFCRQQCQQRGIKFSSHHLHITGKDNLEARARQARYQALEPHCDSADTILLTAHHADDQLETLLLALRRGSGLAGLSGIAAKRSFAKGLLIRPLLTFTRADLEQVAQQQQLSWVDDASNQDTHFDRNFLRQQVLPLLTERWPAFVKTASRSMEHCAQAHKQLEALTAEQATGCINADGELKLRPLAVFSAIEQDAIIRYWLAKQQLNPEQQWLQTLHRDVIAAKHDAAPVLRIADWQIRRFNDRLYLLPYRVDTKVYQRLSWQGEAELSLPDNLGMLLFSHQEPANSSEWLPLKIVAQGVTVCFGNMSSAFKPADALHHKPLKQWCQLWRIPPWQRQRLPLIFHHGKLVAVAGQASHCKCDQATVWLLHVPTVTRDHPI